MTTGKRVEMSRRKITEVKEVFTKYLVLGRKSQMTALYIVSCVFDAFVIYLLFEDIFGKRKSSVNKWILMLALLAQQFISSLILNKTQSVYARLIVMIVGTFFSYAFL